MRNSSAKLAIALLLLGAASFVVLAQPTQVAAAPVTPSGCYAYAGGYYYNASYPYYYYYYGYPYYYYYYGYPYYYYSYPYTYCYYGYGYYYGYYSTPNKYQLTVSTDPGNLGTVSGSGTYTQGSSASFSITQTIIQVDPNTRYVFSHWSGDYSGVGSTGTITMNGPRNIVAVYQLQYQLNVLVQPATAPMPQGAGWYNAGSTVNLNVAGQIIGGADNNRLVFQGWSVDGQSLQPSATLSLTMNSPHSVSAQYKQQFYLKVLTDQGVAYGEGWYDAGSTAQVFASTPVSTGYGVSWVFNGWQGDLQSSSQSATVLMDGAKTVTATWRTDATVLNITIALGIIAAFLAVAGIIAYVAVTKNRYRQQTLKPAPTGPPYTSGPAPPPPLGIETGPARKKVVPVKKKTQPASDETNSPTTA